MLNRQKAILELLRAAERPVSKIELMKWCFLLRHETSSAGGSAFYDFLPYHYGPYSFGLQRELADLTETGYVREEAGKWVRTQVDVGVTPLPTGVKSDAHRLVHRLAATPEDQLLDHVYERYPQFTMNSRRRQLAPRPVGEPGVYTVGYEGRQVDGFLWLLMASGVRRLIDVRNNPVARRYGFHKSTLARLCGALDIEYCHLPELGIPSADRRAEGATVDRLFTTYTSVTIPSQPDAVERVVELVAERPSALMCMEAIPCECHRSRLATVVAARTGLPIRHLGVGHGDEPAG
jgi:uncharacterized protein (DUF488 family)